MGSVAPRPKDFAPNKIGPEYGRIRIAHPLADAIHELESYTGIKIEVVVPFELGALNTAGPIDAAVRLGLRVMDGDCAGRAVPEAVQALPAIWGGRFCPAAICDQWGNILIMKRASSTAVAERLGKMISTVTKAPDPHALCGFAAFLSKAKEMKRMIIPGTLTRTLAIGQAIREARERGEDPVRAAVEALNGWLLFKGEVVEKEWENKQGYMYGITAIEGVEEFAGHSFKIWFKNENHITWKDGVKFVTSPDLIMVVELATAEPIINTYLKKGDMVAVLGKANRIYRSKECLPLLGPRHFGFDFDYVPIEELVTDGV